MRASLPEELQVGRCGYEFGKQSRDVLTATVACLAPPEL